MADHLEFSVHCRPIEELTDEQGNTIKILSGEVNTSLGGSGDSVDLANYNGALNQQGYKDGAVGYLDCVHTAGGVRLTQRANGDSFFIRNTGFVFSSATVLGASTTNCIMVACRILAQSGSNAGWEKADGTSQDHFIELAWLKPGQAIVLPLAANNLKGAQSAIVQFGSNADDLTGMNENAGADSEESFIYVKTYLSTGAVASNGNACEFLCVE